MDKPQTPDHTPTPESHAVFQREERFIVIKRKHLPLAQEDRLRDFLHAEDIDTVECVVVESDWPEYETVWRMIEDRVTGKAQPTPESDYVLETTEEVTLAAYRAIYDPEMDPFDHPEGWEYAEGVARAVLAAARPTPADDAEEATAGEEIARSEHRSDVFQKLTFAAVAVQQRFPEAAATIRSAMESLPDAETLYRLTLAQPRTTEARLREIMAEAFHAIDAALGTSDDVIEWAEPIRASKRGQADDDELRKERKNALYGMLDDARTKLRAALEAERGS